jgi:hypothetical protein
MTRATPAFPQLGLLECSVSVGATGKLFAYNAFLDGNLFRSSHEVDREPGYYDLTWGFRLRWTKIQLDYRFVRRGKEFSPVPITVDSSDGRHDYGSANVQCLDSLDWLCPTFVGLLLGAIAAQ